MSTRAKTLCAVALAASLSTGQADLSGTLYDYHGGKPISGATIRLTSATGLSGVRSTDTTGRFSFTGPLALPVPDMDAFPAVAHSGAGILFRQETSGHVEVRIHPLTGRGSLPVFSGRLDAGLWRIGQPRLAAGVYLCRVRTPEGSYATRFLAADIPAVPRPVFPERMGSPARPVGRSPDSDAAAKRGSAAGRSDSLSITRPGYYPRSISLEGLPRTGLVFYMTDTSIGKTATLVPHSSWNCGMPTGIAPPAKGAAVFQATLTLGAIHPVGLTPYGFRRLLDVSGGAFAGARINGTVHKGGLDLDLTQSVEGTVEIEQILVLRTNDGANIYVRGLGIAMPGDPTGRVVLDFEAPTSGAYAWLNTGTYVATRVVDAAAKTVTLTVYEVSNVARENPRINISDGGNAQQSPDCLTLTGTRGTAVFTENVTLGASFSIAGKRGTRNIIPITGGTTSGRVVGKVLAGGADYQLNGLDARYTLAPDDGELILVRNCGPMNGLVPRFEARVAGPYDFLNANTFLSSEPGVAGSGVNITFYQRR